MNIFGIYCRDGLPVCVYLAKDYDNKQNENHIEIARRFHIASDVQRYSCILLCFGDESVAYSF